LLAGCERFLRPGYSANLVASWLPALERVEGKMRAFPASTFIGSDYHDGSIDQARKSAASAGLSDHATFTVAICTHKCGYEPCRLATAKPPADLGARLFRYQPRARHSGTAGRSVPSVLSLPCPG
jgi:hypothetical protein